MRQQPETIGDAILLYVQQQHGTQANAAIAWHCSTTMLSEVIRGTRRPTERMLAAIARAGTSRRRGSSRLWRDTP